MTIWFDVLDDARGIRAIYGDDAPPLEAVVLHEITLHRDGPRVVLRFDLPAFPSRPPEKWVSQGCNVVQVQLLLSGVESVSIQGLSTHSVVDIAVAGDGRKVRVTTSGSSVIDVLALDASITSISAYMDAERPAP
jgi:hypothetical protein